MPTNQAANQAANQTSQTTGTNTTGTLNAYITKDGKIIKGDILQRYAIKNEDGQSRQIPEDKFKSEYDTKGIKRPPYSLESLSQLPEMSTWHYRACVAKAMDVVGHGYYLEPVPGMDNPNQSQLEIWKEFKERCEGDGETLDEILYKSAYDYEVIGNGGLELIGGLNSEEGLHSMKHIPSHTVRRLKDTKLPLSDGETISSMKIYVQKRGNRKVYFKQAGAQFDIDYRTGEVYPLDTLPVSDRGNEILHIINYTNRSDYYGLPDIMAALPSILGDRQAQIYNVDFFENHGVPDYAVTVTGADLDEETQNTIHNYFQNEVKGTERSTLVLTASREHSSPGDDPIDIKFQKLTAEVKDGSFKIYRQDNRDEILSANGVPPYRASVAVVGSLGGDLAKDMDEIYKENIVDYRQNVVEKRLKAFVLNPLGITDYILRFVEFETGSDEREDEKFRSFYDRAAITPNEMREYLGKETIDEAGMNSFYIQGEPVAGPLFEEMKEAQAEEAAQQAQQAQQATATSLAGLRQDLLEVVRKDG